MNPEIEKLFEAAFTDGFISATERAVLKKKALKLGMSDGEIEIMINARLYADKEATPTDNTKCAKCGAAVNPKENSVCTVCGYNPGTTAGIYLDEYINFDDAAHCNIAAERSTDMARYVEKSELQGSGWQIFVWFKIILSAGLYIPYKLLLRKEPLFDGYRTDTQVRESRITVYRSIKVAELRRSFDEYDSYDNKIEAWRTGARNERVKAFFISLLFFVLFGLPAYGIYAAVGAFKKVQAEKQQEQQPKVVTETDIDKIVDSLTAGSSPATMFKAYAAAHSEIADAVVRNGVDALVSKHKFEEARNLAKELTARDEHNAMQQIEILETIEKYSAKK